MSKDYSVDYGKPPSQHQFKKGKSGNPSGLRKLKRLLKKPLLNPTKLLITELKSPITIKENGKKKKVTKMEVIWKSIVADTINGDKTARKYVMDFMMKQSEYAFEDDGITYCRVNTKAIDALLEEFGQYEIKPDGNQEEGNGSSSSS
jgi:Family of unknown function (DUF5681)